MLRDLISEVCTRAGFTVLEAANGAEALAACQNCQTPIEIMITDLVMPGMSGRALAEKLKVLRPETQVIFCSGYTEHSSLQNGIVENGIVFLQKPFAPDILLRKIQELTAVR